jgi:hypothetical protein
MLLLSAVFFSPLKSPPCLKQHVDTPVAFAATPCSAQQVLNSSCSSFSYWLQEEFHLSSSLIAQSFVGLLSFFLIVAKYTSPLSEIYRPPM